MLSLEVGDGGRDSHLGVESLRQGEIGVGSGVRARPGDIVDEVCLQQKLTAREQVLGNEILVGAHSHAITHTQGTQHIQHLEVKVRGQKARAPGQESVGGLRGKLCQDGVSGQEMGILTEGRWRKWEARDHRKRSRVKDKGQTRD